jgi:hypothetical protein
LVKNEIEEEVKTSLLTTWPALSGEAAEDVSSSFVNLVFPFFQLLHHRTVKCCFLLCFG